MRLAPVPIRYSYGPKSCSLYRAGPTRKVPGRKGMSWEEEDWVDEDMPPAVFPTAEAAYRAWERSQEVAEIRKRRREEALKRLEKS